MKSTKCAQCGFVGWSDENCKACGAPLFQRSTSLPQQVALTARSSNPGQNRKDPNKGWRSPP